jgi:diguanylate cyclase (GGDEF)-like protein
VLLENDQVKEQLCHQPYHAALTGLPNRALFTERVGDALASGSADTAVLFVDLDDFKTINDTLGQCASLRGSGRVTMEMAGVYRRHSGHLVRA